MERLRSEVSLPEDAGAPGGVYLCQVSDRISCGACCGVYNDRLLNSQRLHLQLQQRTRRFAAVRREVEAIDSFGRSTVEQEGRRPKYADFHSCPFVGLVGQNRSRVGCLLHPGAEGNHGVDFRGLSYYGGMACRGYFCPSHRLLTADIKNIVRSTASDWYEYGLLITETAFLQAGFEALRRRNGGEVTPERFYRDPQNRRRLRNFFRLKIQWPYRGRPEHGACNYFFEDERYPAAVRYPASFRGQSRHHRILQALDSDFASRSALQQAEILLDERLEALAEGLR
jgi:hypothetical protein